MFEHFLDYYRCPSTFARFESGEPRLPAVGYFRFGPEAVGFGSADAPWVSATPTGELKDLSRAVSWRDSVCALPFDPDEVVSNLRLERYVSRNMQSPPAGTRNRVARSLYYFIRPLLAVGIRRHPQRIALRGWEKRPFPVWPVDRSVDAIFERMMQLTLQAQGARRIPFIWFWPESFRGCVMMTHDVETRAGVKFCSRLMDLNQSYQVFSSFQFIPERRYRIPDSLLDEIRERGFEVNIHDLNHDGNLFSEREEFSRRASKINDYARQFGAQGFRSGVLYRNLDWYDAFSFSYDMSVPNVGHLDPQPGGCCTVMPYWIGRILELPLTTTQDYSLFHIIGTYSLELWERQIELILEKHGLVSFIVHPDYLLEPRALDTYIELLLYLLKRRLDRRLWVALPGEIDRWWRARSEMRLAKHGDAWRVEGPESERARLAYARLEEERVVYDLA